MKKIYTLLVLLSAMVAQSQDEPVAAARQKFLININAGPSFRTGSIPDGATAAEEQYIKDLKSGTAYDISAYYMKDENRGYGLKYSSFNSSAQMYNVEVNDPTAGPGIADPTDDITITFIGIGAIVSGKGIFEKDNVSGEIALGYIGYRDDFTLLRNYQLKGSNLGISTTVGYHFGITENILIGPAISFTGGVLKKMKLTGNGISETITMEDDAMESLYRFDLSVSARVRF